MSGLQKNASFKEKNMGGIILGIIAALFVLFSLIPFMGIMNVISIPLLIIGLILGILGIVKKEKEKKGTSIAGTVICGLFLIIALARVGGGVRMTKAVVDTATKAATPSSIEQIQSSVDSLNQLSNSLDELSNLLNSN